LVGKRKPRILTTIQPERPPCGRAHRRVRARASPAAYELGVMPSTLTRKLPYGAHRPLSITSLGWAQSGYRHQLQRPGSSYLRGQRRGIRWSRTPLRSGPCRQGRSTRPPAPWRWQSSRQEQKPQRRPTPLSLGPLAIEVPRCTPLARTPRGHQRPPLRGLRRRRISTGD
jgi:hypothetical protein